jgi:soluble lytic murein transglycosylase-like protein
MQIKIITVAVLSTGLLFGNQRFCFAQDEACFEQASQRYAIPVQLLKAISRVESGGNPTAFNRNPNGSWDMGHMQINSAWLPSLEKFGISQMQLRNPCVNTYVGAWILAGNIRRLGYNWKAIGAYNAHSSDKAAVYAGKIAATLNNTRRAL